MKAWRCNAHPTDYGEQGHDEDAELTYEKGRERQPLSVHPHELRRALRGPTTFTGNLTLMNVGGSFLLNQLLGVTMTPGMSFVLASGPEGSNQGGFGPNGLEFSAVGFFSTQAVNLSVFDGQIHSGVPRVSPCDGILTDAFVLQGGSPTGCDNGDGFETTQAPGHFSFVQNGTPEPGTLLLLGSGVIGAFGVVRRKLIG